MINIDELAELNEQYKKLGTRLSDLKKQLKSDGDGTFEGDKYVACVTTRVRQRKLNQDKAIAVINKLGAKWLLKSVVDEEKLEDALAVGELDPKEFADCIDTSYNTVLTFKRRANTENMTGEEKKEYLKKLGEYASSEVDNQIVETAKAIQ